MSSDEIIRELCTRVVTAEDAELQAALDDLHAALHAHVESLRAVAATALLKPLNGSKDARYEPPGVQQHGGLLCLSSGFWPLPYSSLCGKDCFRYQAFFFVLGHAVGIIPDVGREGLASFLLRHGVKHSPRKACPSAP